MNRLGLTVAVLLVALALVGPSNPVQAANLSVTNLNDSGPGSLRQPMLDANATPALDTITFGAGSNVPSLSGVISLLTPLPAITSPMTIVGPGSSLTIN